MNARLRADTDRFAAKVRAAQAARRPRAAREDTPAERAAFAAFRENGTIYADRQLAEMERLQIAEAPALAGRYGEAA